MTTRVVLTYRDYEALPNDGRRYEIHEGELSVTPAPTPRHQKLIGELYLRLVQHVKARGLGEVYLSPIDVILGEATIVQLDLVFVDTTRLGLVSHRGIEGAPTLAVEVLSPSTTLIDRSTKLQLYARHGVPYYWMVDPEARRIEAYRLAETAYALETTASGAAPVMLPPLPDLAFAPASLWG